jgi:hypothetical protein
VFGRNHLEIKETTDCMEAKGTKEMNTNETLIDTNCRIASQAISVVDRNTRGNLGLNCRSFCELTNELQYAINFD